MTKHIISLFSALWVAANLLFGLALLIPVSIIKWLAPVPFISRYCYFLVDHIYRGAVKINSFWMKKVVGIKLVVKGEPNTQSNPVVICNHQSWFDIPVIQDVITGTGPMVKFLIKRELVWVPIIGWICQVMGFPKLGRSKRSDTRKDDITAVQTISMGHDDEAGALLIFPEGTRFSEGKKARQISPYQHLLKPRSGGLKVVKNHVSPDTTLIDLTIDYHKPDVRIWACLHGDPGLITVTITHYRLADIIDVDTWLNNRWAGKDQVFTAGN